MKEEWKSFSIKDCCDILDSRRKPITKSKRESGKIPYYGATGLLDYVKDYIFDEPLVLLGEDGAKWGAGELSAYRIDGKSWVNNHAHVLRPKRDIINDNWLIYFLNYSNLHGYITGVTVPKLNQEKMCSIIVPVPTLFEQELYVDFLDSAFAKIDAMKANAEKALNEAKALFQASLKEMLEPKDGWVETKLADLAEDSADGPFGSNLKKEHYTTNKEVRIIQLSNIGEDGWREDNTKYTTFEHLKTISRSEVEPNDIVIAKMMPAGRAILCPSHEKKYVLSSDAVKIKLKKGPVTRFVLHSINSPYFREKVYENVSGSGRIRTSLTKLRACSIYLPSIEEQNTIVNVLDTIKSKVDRLQANFDKISQECGTLKQAILRQTFE